MEVLPTEGSTCTAPVHVHAAVAALKDELVANRRHFHQHPELSFKEEKTVSVACCKPFCTL